mgnify:CR=1 FL=1
MEDKFSIISNNKIDSDTVNSYINYFVDSFRMIKPRGIMINNNHEISFFIHLNFRVGILITNEKTLKDSDFTYIEPNETNKADLLNKIICNTEKVSGNGFIFGDSKEVIVPYISFIKSN